MESKKIAGVVLLLIAAGGAAWYFLKKKKSTAPVGQPNIISTDKINTAAPTPAPPVASAEQQAFAQLSSIIEADPIWKTKVFPANFYEAVNTEYADFQAGRKGTYNDDANYKNAGRPGAFMGVADAWQNSMGFNDDTHTKLWNVYSQYRSSLAKQALFSFNGLNFCCL